VSGEHCKLRQRGLGRSDMCGGDMSPYLVSGAKPQPPNVYLDIIGAYVSAG